MTEAEMIELATEYAGEHPSFDDSFILSLAEHLERKGELTPNQGAALEKVIQRFRMEEWRDDYRS
jgi:hypothetical protein